LVVAAIASQVWAKCSMVIGFYGDRGDCGNRVGLRNETPVNILMNKEIERSCLAICRPKMPRSVVSEGLESFLPRVTSNAYATLAANFAFFGGSATAPALESGEETLVGGQAVLEGVMMRSPHAWGIAVRKPSGEIVTHSEPLERPSEQHKWMGWPVVRGVMTLGHAMTLGFRALKFSANAALEERSSGSDADTSGFR
jgi:hypothetical protein